MFSSLPSIESLIKPYYLNKQRQWNKSDHLLSYESKVDEIIQSNNTIKSSSPLSYSPSKSNMSEKNKVFSVLSYNILCEKFIEQNYTYCPNKYLDTNYRLKNIFDIINYYNNEIICLQEVDADDWNIIYRHMTSFGYDGMYRQRTGDRPDGVAIFYKKEHFKLLGYESLEYQYTPYADAKDNVALLALFLCIFTNKLLFVGNTHILYNTKRGDLKLGQMQYFLNRIPHFIRFQIDLFDENSSAKLDKNVKNTSILVCGDFNMIPGSDIMNFVTEGVLDCNGLNRTVLDGLGSSKGDVENKYNGNLDNSESLKIGIKLVETFNPRSIKFKIPKKTRDGIYAFQPIHYNPKDNYFTVHHPLNLTSVYTHGISQHHKLHHDQVDYILYSDLKLLEYLSLPELNDLNTLLPNEASPSDHMYLLSKFEL